MEILVTQIEVFQKTVGDVERFLFRHGVAPATVKCIVSSPEIKIEFTEGKVLVAYTYNQRPHECCFDDLDCPMRAS